MSEADAEIQTANDTVTLLMDKGIKLLALDFDKTIISIHTGGLWRSSTEKLTEYIRPCFKNLIKAALDHKLQTCIVTYSMQPDVIKEFLKLVFPKRQVLIVKSQSLLSPVVLKQFCSFSDVSKILVRASSSDWADAPTIATIGKEKHITWCLSQLYEKKKLIIEKHEIVLFDDDDDNIENALEFGHHAYEVPDDVTAKHLKDYVSELEVKKAPTFS